MIGTSCGCAPPWNGWPFFQSVSGGRNVTRQRWRNLVNFRSSVTRGRRGLKTALALFCLLDDKEGGKCGREAGVKAGDGRALYSACLITSANQPRHCTRFSRSVYTDQAGQTYKKHTLCSRLDYVRCIADIAHLPKQSYQMNLRDGRWSDCRLYVMLNKEGIIARARNVPWPWRPRFKNASNLPKDSKNVINLLVVVTKTFSQCKQKRYKRELSTI